MADLTVTPSSVRPLPGALIRGGNLGEAAGLGDLVAVKNDGKYWKADANAVVAPAIGLIVAIGGEGALTGAAGDRVSVLFIGPMVGLTGTAGSKGYLSDTAGKVADAVSATTAQIIGVFLEANTFWVNPNLV